MAEQVPDGQLAGNPGVVELKAREMLLDGVVPADLTFVHQHR
jgi:hypothetical protein